jgi:heme-degrading monooxygenase HmoA
MKTLTALTSLFLAACGPMELMTADDLPAVDEATCTKDALEADGVDSARIEALPTGRYVVSTTYLRLPHKKSALKRFSELVAPMDADLRANPGVVRVTTRLSTACNTARTLTVWKSEADMYRFVASPSHAKAMGAVSEVSRGNSVTTHWDADETGATWEQATRMLAADSDGPVY